MLSLCLRKFKGNKKTGSVNRKSSNAKKIGRANCYVFRWSPNLTKVHIRYLRICNLGNLFADTVNCREMCHTVYSIIKLHFDNILSRIKLTF
jgi:hypothetical protein